ncbi:MAG: retropepsin-like aspartic protease [Simplicispira sp.]|nr:retropepsin-like aspartic protease [Simplicispira sp.]
MPEHQVHRNASSTRSLMRWGTLGILAFWLAVMAVLYMAMEHVRQPRAAVVAADGALVIPRGSDGHFHVAGSINGQPVVFMVDTGASLIAVTDALAQQAGLAGGQVTQFRTANGVRQGRAVVAQSVTVGNFVVSGLRVGTGYTGQAAGDALLGQNFLQHFEVQMQRDRMVLRPHP